MFPKSIQTRTQLLMVLLLAAFCAPLCRAESDPFGKGRLRGSVVAGSGRTLDNNYIIIGLGAAYYMVDGLELGLDGEAWLGADPGIYKLSPQAKYVLPIRSKIRPYLGAFYSHVFIEDYDDLDTVGGRGGVYLLQNKQWFFGVGVVYESYLDCDEALYNSCDDVYPEFTFAISF